MASYGPVSISAEFGFQRIAVQGFSFSARGGCRWLGEGSRLPVWMRKFGMLSSTGKGYGCFGIKDVCGRPDVDEETEWKWKL